MARSVTVPPLAASRQYPAACRVMLKVPFRWTAITSSNSCSLMETSIRSRRIPALLTTTWRSPNVETAWSTIAFAPSKELTLSVLATACPPAAVISSATDCAADTSAPEPSTAPPRSLTTTLAPSDPKRRACSRPMPRPPPVMIATLSCNMVQPSSRFSCRRGPKGDGAVRAERLQRHPGVSNRRQADTSRRRRSRYRRSASVPARSRASRYASAASTRRPRRRSMSARAAGRRW